MEPTEATARELDRLKIVANPQRRGKMFEKLIGRLFERARLRVVVGSQVASPRDADVFASGRDEFIVEAKWQRAPVDVSDIDALRDRLARTSPRVVGVLVSMSGFTSGAIELVEMNRDRPILLVQQDEVEALCEDLALRPLLRHKMWALRVHARVLFAGRDPLWPTDWQPRRSAWPEPNARPAQQQPWIAGRAGVEPILFVGELPDIDWTVALGVGVAFDLQLPLDTSDQLATGFEILYSHGWLTGEGRFRIEQPGRTAWYGWGAAGFVDAIVRQKARLAGEHGWHSEERADYFDTCPGGWYTLTLRVLTGSRRIFGGAHLSAQLAGIPTEMTPMRMLAEAFDLDDHAFFRPLTDRHAVQLKQFRSGDVPLEAADLVLDADDPTWVSGLVVRNPSFSYPDEKALGELVGGDEFVICALASWHEVGDRRRYHLRAVESAASGSVRLARVVADWA